MYNQVIFFFFIAESREELTKSTHSLYPFDFPDGRYRSNYFSVYHLVTHVEDMHVEDTFQYSLVSVNEIYIIKYFFCSVKILTMFCFT